MPRLTKHIHIFIQWISKEIASITIERSLHLISKETNTVRIHSIKVHHRDSIHLSMTHIPQRINLKRSSNSNTNCSNNSNNSSNNLLGQVNEHHKLILEAQELKEKGCNSIKAGNKHVFSSNNNNNHRSNRSYLKGKITTNRASIHNKNRSTMVKFYLLFH